MYMPCFQTTAVADKTLLPNFQPKWSKTVTLCTPKELKNCTLGVTLDTYLFNFF